MSKPSPYLRTFVLGAFWFGAVALRMVSRHPDHWSTYPARNVFVLVIAWVANGLLLGVVATRFERMPSWWTTALGTVAGSLLVLGFMLFTVERMHSSPAPPQFKNSDAMMAYFATQVTKWVKKD